MASQDIAARHLSYKVSLTVGDVLVLFVYAPTQLTWIHFYWVSHDTLRVLTEAVQNE